MCFVLWNLKISLRSVICAGRGVPWEKIGQRRKHPPPMGGADPLACQQFSRREFVERRANIGAVVEVPSTDKRVGERLHGVAVVTLQVVDQARRDSGNRAIRYRPAALKRH